MHSTGHGRAVMKNYSAAKAAVSKAHAKAIIEF
jgi:hypothetical protein